MVQLIIGIVFGGLISWLVSHQYYKKANLSPPEWAIPIIEKLPLIAPSEEEFLKLFQKEVSEGTIIPHPVFKHVACPNCNTPIGELVEKIMGDDIHTILNISCPYCGWSDWAEV